MVGNQVLQIAAGIALSRVYGPPGKGLVTYAGIAILGVIATADGLSSAIARQCRDDHSKGPSACAAALRVILYITGAFAFPLIALGVFVPAQHALLYVGIALPFALYVQTMSGFHLLDLRVERTNVASLVINAGAALVMLLATVFERPPIDVIMAVWTAGYLAGAAIIFAGLDRTHVSRHEVDDMLAVQFPFVIRASSASLMTFLAARIDVFIVAATLSATALGTYTLALACGEFMWQVGRAMSWSAFGRVATLPIAAASELTARITRLVIAIEGVAAITAFCLGPTLVTLVYGSAFSSAGVVLRFLLPGMALYAADSILTYYIAVKLGRPGSVLRIETLTLSVCVVGSLLTVGRYGMIGPAIATTTAYLVSFAVKSLLFVRATDTNLRTLLILKPADFQPQASRSDSTGSAVA